MEALYECDSYLDFIGRKKDAYKRDRPTKVIIDTDPGGDDAQAIILAIHLARKYNVQILGLTTIAGNGSLDNVVKNAQLIVNACNTPEIPIFRGNEDFLHPFEYQHYHYGEDGFGGYQAMQTDLQLTNLSDKSAIDFLIESVK